MNETELLKMALGTFKSIVIPFISSKTKELLMKQIRLNKKITTIILIPRFSGKSEFKKMIEIDNKVIVLDFDDIINQNNEYKNIILNSNDNIMTIPYKYTVYKQIRDNFKSKSVVILTSDAMFNDFLTENEKKLIQ